MASALKSPDVAQPPRPAVRAAVSLLVIFHVVAVFVGPWAMPPQTSELSGGIARFYRPYLEGLFLANGYRFFAPEPGPSHLVRYEMTLNDGSQATGVFPDRAHHVPRLLYHRYFMLSEFVNTLESAGGPRQIAEAYAKSYAEHLAHENNAKTVTLYLRRHFVPRMSEVREGMKLSDKRLYDEHLLASFTRDEP